MRVQLLDAYMGPPLLTQMRANTEDTRALVVLACSMSFTVLEHFKKLRALVEKLVFAASLSSRIKLTDSD